MTGTIMAEWVYLTGLIVIIAFTTWGILHFGKVKGARSHRGLAVTLSLAASWGVAMVAATIFIPLAIVALLAVQIPILKFVAKQSIVRSIILSVIYSVVTYGLIMALTMLIPSSL